MFSFTHYSYRVVTSQELQAAGIDPASQAKRPNGKPVVEASGDKDKPFKVWGWEVIPFPDQPQDFATIDDGSEVEVEMDGTKRKVSQKVFDWWTGRKLRSNQDFGKQFKADPKGELRRRTMAWLGRTPEGMSDVFRRMTAASTPAKTKEHNDWLDQQYSDNKDAIEAYQPK